MTRLFSRNVNAGIKQYKGLGYLILLAGLSACSDDSTHVIDNYDDIPKFLEHQKIPGISIATIKDFAVDKVMVYGFKQANSDQPVSRNTMFQAGALSQSVTAVAAMKIFQDAEISLDSDINQTLTSWELDAGQYASEKKASLRRLLSHTAGTNVGGYPGYSPGESLPSHIQILNNTGNSNSPGVILNGQSGVYQYSAGGYSVVQQALVDQLRQPFKKTMDDTVLRPLGMSNSTFEQPLSRSLAKSASAGHDANGNMLPGKYQVYPELAASGLWTTAEDLAKFVVEVQSALQGESKTSLSRDYADQMMAPVSYTYGLGFDVETRGDSIYFGNGGMSQGFQSLIIAHKTAGVGVVIMTNSNNGFQAITRLVDYIGDREGWPDY